MLAWLFARARGARFLMRVEDLDEGRVRAGLAEAQLADLAAVGLDWDGPVVRQSERTALYRDALARLERDGLVYPCYCTRAEIREAASAPHGPLPEGAYPGTCRELSSAQRRERDAGGRPPALRVRAGQARVAFVDRLLGSQQGVVDDLVVRRNDGAYAYNLAVVVDDAAQGIGEVVRGADHGNGRCSKSELWPAPSRWTASPAATVRQTRSSGSWMHSEYVVAVSCGSRSNGPLAGRGLPGASGEEEVPDRLEPRSWF